MNAWGFYTLFFKEIRRFMKVAIQTILTPVITVLLYLLVFSSALAEHVQVYDGVSYIEFLIPGLMMMSLIQNAFANSSSSLFQSKMTGNLVFMLLAPLSSLEIYLAFVAAAVIRGLMVGTCVWLAATAFVILPVYHLGVLLGFAILGSAMLGALGLIAGLWAEKWDHIAVFQNFIILPLSFLSGTFYRINTLPDFWQHLSYYNPFLYMIEGFRYGFIGIADVPIGMSLVISGIFLVIISAICLWLLHSGFKIRG